MAWFLHAPNVLLLREVPVLYPRHVRHLYLLRRGFQKSYVGIWTYPLRPLRTEAKKMSPLETKFRPVNVRLRLLGFCMPGKVPL